MGGSMVAELEPLDASGCASGRHYVFTLVSVFFPWGWQSFALDWQKRIELCVPTAFDDDDRTTRLRSQVDGSSATNFVRNLGAKLDPIPASRKSRCAVQVIAELIGEGRFGGFRLSLGVVAPAGQFVCNEFDKLISGSPW